MRKILYPFKYFRLVNNEKRFIDFVPTLLLALIILAPFLLLPKANFFGIGGFLANLILLTAALTGFYVAALVAAATFAHPDLDKTIRSGPIALITRDSDGKRVAEALSRREFTTMMFGFLAFSAMGFTIFASAAVPIAAALPREISLWFAPTVDLGPYLAIAGEIVATLWISHLFVVTCLGLYYLMDRLYRHDMAILTPKDDKKAGKAA